MADGDGDALLLKPPVEGVEPLPLCPGPSQVQTVGCGEMAEQALGLQSGQFGTENEESCCGLVAEHC